eukprot:8797483-Pyramimonas_sp.AAC.1
MAGSPPGSVKRALAATVDRFCHDHCRRFAPPAYLSLLTSPLVSTAQMICPGRPWRSQLAGE